MAESQSLQDAEFNRASVLLAYFGYLRRNPDDAPDENFSGYDSRLAQLDGGGENKLHHLFSRQRVNRINECKEFFRVSIEEIARAVRENHGEINLTLAAGAAEYRKTLALLREEQPAAVAARSVAVA
ncbi:MAG: hypothetical protein M3444_05570 [Acidobacteriota bacterium]|nr:hypothetical protein [Acidobacteriota bacterium]